MREREVVVVIIIINKQTNKHMNRGQKERIGLAGLGLQDNKISGIFMYDTCDFNSLMKDFRNGHSCPATVSLPCPGHT
jgi:hypothetical protein